jgi:hypothetical protein
MCAIARIAITFVLGAVLIVPALPGSSSQDTENERAAVLKKPIEGPIALGRRKFTDALAAMGHAMRSHFVIYGIESADGDYPVEPTVSVDAGPNVTIGEYLDDILRQAGSYEYEMVSSHLLSVYPKGAKQNPSDVLNFKIGRFDVTEADSGPIMAFPDKFIPELREKLFPAEAGKQQIFTYVGPIPPGPKVTLQLRDVTVREILNAVTVATETPRGDSPGDAPYGWIYCNRDSTGTKKPYWGVFSCLPPNWRQLVHFTGRGKPPR